MCNKSMRNNKKTFPIFLNYRKFVESDEIPIEDYETVCTNTKYKYINLPCAFDIETSSFRSTGNGEKVGIMYAWAFGLNGKITMGRTWEEFKSLINLIIDRMDISLQSRLIVYVHNLAYEFQFMQKLFVWHKVFAIDSRKPIYAITEDGIEFRCSYLLSGYNLETLGKNLQTYKVKKLVGDLDYSLIRHSETTLTESEKGYLMNDIKVVLAYIQESIESNGDISRIPLTKTGYVRNYCRKCCLTPTENDKWKRLKYRQLMKSLRLTVDEYKQLKRAFQGGFTHSNPFYTDKVIYNVLSEDFISKYPSEMVAQKFPMSSSERYNPVDRKDFDRCLKLYCCLFDIEFTGLESKLYHDSYISLSRCWQVQNAVVNNGRIVSADHLITTITEQDFYIIERFYNWESMKIANFRRYRKDYLPTDFVKAILKLYRDKTELKGVVGKEAEYLHSKEMLNSCYG